MAKERSLHVLRRYLVRTSDGEPPDSITSPTAVPSKGRAGRLETTAWVIGVSLLAFVAGVKVVGDSLARREVRRFEHALQAAAPAAAAAPSSLPLETHDVNQSLWAETRVQAYARALKVAAPAALAVLRIPRIGLEGPVLPGTDEWTLDRGLGWIEGTARPGELGNVGIAGHRDGFFRGLKDVKPGDAIEVTTVSGEQLFRIERISIVSPDDVGVLSPTSTPALTLVTCFPFYFVGSAPERYVVRAVLSSPQAAAARGL